jgi:hypothetical protein
MSDRRPSPISGLGKVSKLVAKSFSRGALGVPFSDDKIVPPSSQSLIIRFSVFFQFAYSKQLMVDLATALFASMRKSSISIACAAHFGNSVRRKLG